MKKISLFLSVFALITVYFFAFHPFSVHATETYCTHPKEEYTFVSVKETSTCIFKGVAVYACPTCGKEEFRSLPFAEHTPGEWIVKTDSTCSRVGIEECFCADCNVAFQTREIETKPHNFGEWGITTPPTCCEEGVQKRICERCGARESKPVLQTDVHVFGESEIFRNSTCSEHGYRKRTCLTCEESIYLSLAMDAEEHHFGEGEIIVKQSCLFEGKIRYTCADCGEVKEQILPAKGHRMTIVGKNEVVCSCGYSETTVKKFGKIQQIFASEKGTLTIESLALANGEYHFDFCEMTDVLTNEYRKYYPGFFKAYLWKLEFAGKPYELTSKMTFSIPIDEELEDHRIKIAVLREGRFYYLENVRIKNGEILINGELLSGAEAIFLEKGERITMSVAIPIIVTAVTVVLAAGAICLILFRAGIFRKKSNGTDEPTLPVNPQE